MCSQLSGTASPENPVQTPSLQKAQMFAGHAEGLRIKQGVSWQHMADRILCLQGQGSTHDDQLPRNQHLLVSVGGSGSKNNTVKAATYLCRLFVPPERVTF